MPKILIYTDSNFTMPLLEIFLNDLNYKEIIYAADYDEFLNNLNNFKIDLIILDPLMDNFETFLQKNIPFILIENPDGLEFNADEYDNFFGFLKRPINKENLKNLLQKIFQNF